MPANTDSQPLTRPQLRILLGSVFIIAACSLLYELLISSLSTYLLGSSVVHYSLTIGLFLFFMGIGAGMSAWIKTELIQVFVAVELIIGLLGGLSAAVLFAAYVWSDTYYPVMLVVIAAISTLIGMEIPLLTRMIETSEGLRKSISEVLSLDYLGALIASLLFPFILLPYFGHLAAAAAAGLLNLVVALFVCWHFRNHLGKWLWPLTICGLAGILVLALLGASHKPILRIMEQALYQDTILVSEQSRHQKLVVTRWGDDIRLFLNNNLQFSSIDEYRYHETLVHVPAAFSVRTSRVLIIGGGDGLAVREALRYPDVETITVVELDAAVTKLASEMPALRTLNDGALSDPRVNLVHQDAWQWLDESGGLFDLILIDLPDPATEETARLYTVAFYQRAARRLSGGGVLMTQATSPWFAREAFWSIGTTLEEVFDHVRPASIYVPSFGPWGFFAAANHRLDTPRPPPDGLEFMTVTELQRSLMLADDMQRITVEANRIGSLPILRYYANGWDMINVGQNRP